MMISDDFRTTAVRFPYDFCAIGCARSLTRVVLRGTLTSGGALEEEGAHAVLRRACVERNARARARVPAPLLRVSFARARYRCRYRYRYRYRHRYRYPTAARRAPVQCDAIVALHSRSSLSSGQRLLRDHRLQRAASVLLPICSRFAPDLLPICSWSQL